MFKRVLLLLLLVAVLVVPGAAETVIYDETFTYSSNGYITVTSKYSGSTPGNQPINCIAFTDNVRSFDIIQIICQAETTAFYRPPIDTDFWSVSFTDESGQTVGEGTFYYFPFKVGDKDYLQCVIDIDELDLESSTSLYVYLSNPPAGKQYPRLRFGSLATQWPGGAAADLNTDLSLHYALITHKFSTAIGAKVHPSVKWSTIYDQKWQNQIIITEYGSGTEFNLIRDFDVNTFSSLTVDTKLGTRLQSLNKNTNEVYYLVNEHYPLNVTLDPLVTTPYYRIIHLGGTSVPGAWVPCTINVYDADSRLPLSGDWDYYIVVRGADSVSGSASGASAVVDLPVTSILQPHLLRVTKEGYEQTAPLAFDVPAGGREVNVYLTPLDTTAPEGSSVVTFVVTDIETGIPRGQCLVNVDGVGKYAGASGTAWFVLPENTTHQWLVTAEGYWPIGGNFTLGVDDLVIPVEMTKKTSELPRPPMPGIPGLPVIHPSLDPAGFRMQILSVPILGDLASPLLDTVDSLGVGLDEIAIAVLDFMTAPADQITGAVSSVSQNLIDTATPYLSMSSLLLQVIGAAVSCLPAQVTGLVTFGLVLDIVRILLWGPA